MNYVSGNGDLNLLIVLNGIEISVYTDSRTEAQTFNRTKWN